MNQKTKRLLLALVGLIGIAGFFAIFLRTNAVQLLQLTVPRSEIAAKAQQAFEQSVLADQDLDKSVDVNIRSELFRYAQLHFDENAQDRYLALARWQYTWRGDFAQEDDAEKKEKAEKTSVNFHTEYDFNGRLVRQECEAPKSFTMAILEEDEALARANIFLVSNGIDVGVLELKNNALTRESDIQTYKFEFERSNSITSDIVDKFTVELTGDVITKYVALSDFTDASLKTPDIEKNIQVGFASSIAIFWIIFIIAFIVVFVKRLRHDELDFKRAKWIGIVVFLLMAGMIAIETYPEWMGMLLGGGLLGLFVGAGALIAFATTESINREVWPEKIALSDLIFRGYFRVREIGAAILNMVFLAGISLLILAGMIWLTEKTGIGYLEFEGDDVELLIGTSNFTMHLIAKLIQVCFIGTVLLSFWPSFLWSKIQKNLYFLLATGISILAGGIYITFILPAHIAFFLAIPLAFLWAWFSYKYDFLTLVLALGLTYLCISVAMLGLLPDGLNSVPGMGLAALLVASFITGLYLLRSEHSVTDIENYVPEYVSRIAERERFLKELEIARRIQLQFLPQADPDFPNLEITGICKPAMEVGGDYFDFIQDGDRYFSVVIGDVSGKGVSAAFYMTMAKGIIKTVAKKFRAPKLVLSEMNAVFYENTPREVFISAIYGIFDMQEHT
ncbi:MAG: PP2C family protein-serine/threonine phosphatase, partial [bacterium]